MIESVTLAIRHALRPLRRSTGFAVLAAMMLAVGIASTTAVFSLIRGVLLTPPPYEDPERLVFMMTASAEDRDVSGLFAWPEQAWEEWFVDTESFESIAGYRWFFSYLVSDDGSEPVEGMMVSEGYFSVVGIEPAIGRAFVDADSEGTENPAIILGHDLWMRRFNGDPEILGQTVRVSRSPPATVIGVMPPDVRFLPSPGVAAEPNYDLHGKVDFWTPIPRQFRGAPAWNVVGRLKPGVTTTAAEAEAGVVMARQAETVPQLEGVGARIDPMTSLLNSEAERLLLPLLAAAGLVLLIAAGNAAALLLIRGLKRQHEFGLRTAIGASRGRMFALVLGESMTLAVLSGVVGVILALVMIRLFVLISGDAIPRIDDVTIGWPVLAFGLGAALIACVVAALVPAIRAAVLNPVDALRSGGAKASEGRGQRRLLAGVVVGQTALTLALLVGAGLLIRTIYNLDLVQPGYDTRNILTMSVTSVENDWQGFHTRALERVEALPGVDAAAFAWGVPLTGNAWPSRIEVEGYETPSLDDNFVALPLRSVTPGYFDMLGQPVLVGRDFRHDDDRESDQVAVVNETFVERFLGGGNAIGKTILWPRGGDQDPAIQIVGIIGDSRTNDLTAAPEPEVYLPLWQATAFSKHLVVRTRATPDATAGSIRAALRELAPTVAIDSVRTLDEIRGESLATRSFAMQLLIGFAVIACALTLGGIYSVLSLSVAARRRELAIRSAVGAERGRLMGLVLGQGLRIVIIGAVVGVVASLALSTLLETWLFGVEPADPLTLVGATGLFVIVALVACWAPAWRASETDPVDALRAE